MSDQLLWMVGNRNPSITENLLYSDGTVVDLTGKTVKFKMRAVGSATLKVNTAAVVISAPLGTVRYDWAALDVDTAGHYLVWWEVTTTADGKTQDVSEAVIEFRAHAPETNAYVELEEFKSTAELTGTSFSDQDILTALVAASRGIDQAFGRRFYPDIDANQIRYYSPDSPTWLRIDDLITFTALATDQGGNGTFSNTWTQNTDFVLEPLNAVADGTPFQSIKANSRSSLYFPTTYPRTVKLTGKFGWATVPAGIKEATTLVAARLVKRTREAPFGIVSFGLEGAAVRAASMMRDPEFSFIAETYSRNSGIH
jgi:hypothetical protein